MRKNDSINLKYNVIKYVENPYDIRVKQSPTTKNDSSKVLSINTDPYKSYLASIPSILPLKNLNRKYMISSFYKKRLHPVEQTMKMHNGVDIAAPIGTPVHATADGIIIKIFPNNSPIGYAIKIKHAHHYQTLYGHLHALPNYQVGWEVKRGQIIGYVGSTGLSTAPHLHYCVYYRAMPINPYQYLNLLK
jgi:murein DD-endopeptidase MepM/ murein hydrolase activator NlpD